MKTILLPFHDDPVAEVALATAHKVAEQFGSYLEGMFVHPLPQIVAGEGITVPGAYITQPAENARELAGKARERFNRFMSEHGVPLREVGFLSATATAGWREVEGLESQIVAEYGRLFDLIVIGRTSTHAMPDWNAMCEGALFESGRPVLVAGAEVPTVLGRKVMIAWNGSTETARTIAVGMPFLHRAERVDVLTVEGGTVSGPSGEQIASHLVRNDIEAQARTVKPEGRSVGETILREAAETEADLLLKGAYTQSRLRQMIFGGATRHILSEAGLPVLLAH